MTTRTPRRLGPYVEHIVIRGVPDPFNPDYLWRRPGLFGGNAMLRDAITAHPRHRKGHAQVSYFTHFELLLPREDIEYDRRISGGRDGKDLCAALAELYCRDFDKTLAKREEVRFSIMPSDHLAADEVMVRFGHAVFVPGAEEQPRYRVTVSTDCAVWRPLCEIYARQRVTLVSGNNIERSFPVGTWPFPPQVGLMLINEPSKSTLEFTSEPLDVLDCSYDEERDCTIVALSANTMLPREPTDGARIPKSQPRLMFRVERLAETRHPAAAPALEALDDDKLTRQPKLASDVLLSGRVEPRLPAMVAETCASPARDQETYISVIQLSAQPAPGTVAETYVPLRAQSITLVAIALQRLSIYRHTPVREMVLGFDSDLRLKGLPFDADVALRLRIDTQDRLRAETPAGQASIKLPACFSPTPEHDIHIEPVPEPMRDLYLAFLRLPHPRSAIVPEGSLLPVGRDQPLLSDLRILNSAAFLLTDDTGRGATPDRLGLSRKAFGIEAAMDGLHIVRQSATQALYHLDENLDFVSRIDAHEPGQPYVLPPRHHLVAGHYVMRYDV